MIKYIDVICKMHHTGKITPLSIIWEDGKTFEIDKILDVRKCASTKGGGKGTRYSCLILGQQKFLFVDGYLWWIELP